MVLWLVFGGFVASLLMRAGFLVFLVLLVYVLSFVCLLHRGFSRVFFIACKHLDWG